MERGLHLSSVATTTLTNARKRLQELLLHPGPAIRTIQPEPVEIRKQSTEGLETQVHVNSSTPAVLQFDNRDHPLPLPRETPVVYLANDQVSHEEFTETLAGYAGGTGFQVIKTYRVFLYKLYFSYAHLMKATRLS